MSKLKNMIESLRVLVLDPPWDYYYSLVQLVDSMVESPELERLSNDEIRSFKSFHITLHRCATMEPDTMIKHVAAHWLGTTEQAVRKLPIGPEAVAVFSRLVQSYED